MATQLKGFKFRIYPDNSQKEFLAKQFGCNRFIYNHFLANRKSDYLNNKKSSSYHKDCKLLTDLKELDGYSWLNDVNSQSLQFALKNLDSAYIKFFKKQTAFPKFHKKLNKQCFKIPQFFKVSCGKLTIPKLKTKIKIKLHQELPKKQTALFISKNPSEQYFATFLCEVDIQELPKNNYSIGIDLGIKDLVITSEGETHPNHKHHRYAKKKLKFNQRKLSRKVKGSNNKNKQRIKIAKLYQKVSNKKYDQINKLTRSLINENQVIITENLAVKNMMKNHKLAKSISEVSWGEILRQLEYKAKWYGRTLHQIDRFYPSSKTCNSCKFLVEELPLNIREWNCPRCKSNLNRDVNAARNILEKGLKDLGLWNVIPYQKLVEASSIEESMKQEASAFRQR